MLRMVPLPHDAGEDALFLPRFRATEFTQVEFATLSLSCAAG